MEKEKKFICAKCGSESSGHPGSCCGEERKEKKNDSDASGGHTCVSC